MAANSSSLRTLLLVVLSLASPSSSMKSFKPEGGADELGHMAPKVLKLERQSVVLPKSATRPGRKNFYSAKLSVGEPARVFHVAFDLGGGTAVLPSETCTDPACLERRRYDRLSSNTAEDINANGQLVERKKPKTLLQKRDRGRLGQVSDVGAGQVSGIFVRDKVCVHGEEDEDEAGEADRCFPLAMLIANKMSDMPFALEPYDGTIGLGLKGMSVGMEFNFLAAFQQGYANNQKGAFSNSFGLHIGAGGDDGGEITFGGYDIKRLSHPLKWAPVADPQEGRWQVAIVAIRIGNNTIEACRNRACRAAIDYSASLLGVPSKLAGGLESVLADLAPPAGFGDGCQRLAIPDIHLDLDNDVTLTIPSEDFVNDFGIQKDIISKKSCKPLVTHHDVTDIGPDMFILGESTLRRYYTFFNADTLSIGFSLAAGSLPKDKENLLRLPGGKTDKMKEALGGDRPVILLMQVKLVRSKTISSLASCLDDPEDDDLNL